MGEASSYSWATEMFIVFIILVTIMVLIAIHLTMMLEMGAED